MQKLLIIGCGDIARRTLRHLAGRYRLYALLRDPAQCTLWRQAGVTPLLADLDSKSTLTRFSGLADNILYFAPPPDRGTGDPRMRRVLAALCAGKSLPQRLVYVSTSGVYGDCAGQRIDETRTVRPQTGRALRRVDAEQQLRAFGRKSGVCVSILRAPGIYAADRLPIERLKKGTYALCAEDDVFTNHIHADDLAMLVCAALRYGRANRVDNASDDSEIKMGDYFDLVADAFTLPKAPRLARSQAERVLPLMQLSFMSESRRLGNARIKKELRARLRYPAVANGISAAQEKRMSPCS